MNFDIKFDIKKHTILEVLHGSHAYGLANEESDIDIRGVAIPPRPYFTGFVHGFEQYRSKVEDIEIHNIRKFFRLAANCSPNFLGILYVPERCLRKVTPWGERLIENRQLFLSKKAKFSFSCYALSQLRLIGDHRYYNCKPAMHLVRLMRMCREILTQGKVLVERPDREELLAIRDGAWSHDKLVSWAKAQDKELDALYESCKILPELPDIEKLDGLCVEIVEDFLSQVGSPRHSTGRPIG